LHEVSGAVEQVQLTVREKIREPPGHGDVEVPVAGAEDDPNRRREPPKLADAPTAAEYRAKQIVFQPPECGPRGWEVLIVSRPGDLGDSDYCAPAGATEAVC
jgi:hypothetical protein